MDIEAGSNWSEDVLTHGALHDFVNGKIRTSWIFAVE
jgi:hypothetical protein